MPVVAFSIVFHAQRMAHFVGDDVRALEIPSLENRTRVQLVAHPADRRHADNVVYLFTSLVARVHIHRWNSVSSITVDDSWESRRGQSFLKRPHSDGKEDGNENFNSSTELVEEVLMTSKSETTRLGRVHCKTP